MGPAQKHSLENPTSVQILIYHVPVYLLIRLSFGTTMCTTRNILLFFSYSGLTVTVAVLLLIKSQLTLLRSLLQTEVWIPLTLSVCTFIASQRRFKFASEQPKWSMKGSRLKDGREISKTRRFQFLLSIFPICCSQT